MKSIETAVLGGGCFWCLDAVFVRLRGLDTVFPGYMGGVSDKPTYEAVCSGLTEHIEVVRVTFTPELISFTDLLRIFFTIHDPTTYDRQAPMLALNIGPSSLAHQRIRLGLRRS